MYRRTVLKELAGLPLMSGCTAPGCGVAARPVLHLRSGEPGWPDPAQWAALGQSVGRRLVKAQSLFAVCEPNTGAAASADLSQDVPDPFYIQEKAALTQTLGWTDARPSQPSAYVLLAASSADVAAAVNPAGKTIALSHFGWGGFSGRWRLV